MTELQKLQDAETEFQEMMIGLDMLSYALEGTLRFPFANNLWADDCRRLFNGSQTITAYLEERRKTAPEGFDALIPNSNEALAMVALEIDVPRLIDERFALLEQAQKDGVVQ